MRSFEAICTRARMRMGLGAAVMALAVAISACSEPPPQPEPDPAGVADPDAPEVSTPADTGVVEAGPGPASLAGITGARRLPAGLEPVIADELASMWTQCGDTLVTAFRNRRGRPHARAFIEANGLSVRVSQAAATAPADLPAGVDWVGTVQLRTSNHRYYQQPDRAIDPDFSEVTRAGWNDWVESRRPLPMWAIERRNGQWVVTRFMPNWTEERAQQYRVQHTAVDCAQVPAR